MTVKNLPPDARPREKLQMRGASALSDAELLALLLRTGIVGKGVLQMADELLQLQGRRTADGSARGVQPRGTVQVPGRGGSGAPGHEAMRPANPGAGCGG